MKRYSNIYEKIYSYDNLLTAHKNAKKGKSHYNQVIEVNNNTEKYLLELQKSIKRTLQKIS